MEAAEGESEGPAEAAAAPTSPRSEHKPDTGGDFGKVSQVKPEEADLEHEKLLEEFQRFLELYKGDMDPTTTFKLISSHGRMKDFLFFATLLGAAVLVPDSCSASLHLLHLRCALDLGSS